MIWSIYQWLCVAAVSVSLVGLAVLALSVWYSDRKQPGALGRLDERWRASLKQAARWLAEDQPTSYVLDTLADDRTFDIQKLREVFRDKRAARDRVIANLAVKEELQSNAEWAKQLRRSFFEGLEAPKGGLPEDAWKASETYLAICRCLTPEECEEGKPADSENGSLAPGYGAEVADSASFNQA